MGLWSGARRETRAHHPETIHSGICTHCGEAPRQGGQWGHRDRCTVSTGLCAQEDLLLEWLSVGPQGQVCAQEGPALRVVVSA